MECFCDYEMPEFCHEENRTARKDRTCTECRCAIEIGETYEHVRGKWDGELNTFDLCPRCVSLRDWVKSHVPCFCWAYGNIHDDAIEHAQHYAHEAPGLLFGAYRRLVAIRNHLKPYNAGANRTPTAQPLGVRLSD